MGRKQGPWPPGTADRNLRANLRGDAQRDVTHCRAMCTLGLRFHREGLTLHAFKAALAGLTQQPFQRPDAPGSSFRKTFQKHVIYLLLFPAVGHESQKPQSSSFVFIFCSRHGDSSEILVFLNYMQFYCI